MEVMEQRAGDGVAGDKGGSVQKDEGKNDHVEFVQKLCFFAALGLQKFAGFHKFSLGSSALGKLAQHDEREQVQFHARQMFSRPDTAPLPTAFRWVMPGHRYCYSFWLCLCGWQESFVEIFGSESHFVARSLIEDKKRARRSSHRLLNLRLCFGQCPRRPNPKRVICNDLENIEILEHSRALPILRGETIEGPRPPGCRIWHTS